MMRTLLLAFLLVLALCGSAYSASLTTDDFYGPTPSATMRDYREAVFHFHGQRFEFVTDKQMGYTVSGYLYTREMVQDHIQALVDEFNISDKDSVQWLIDTYAYYTPDPGEVLVFAYFEGPHMENRYYKDFLDDWPSFVSLEFGVDQIERIIEQQRSNVEHYMGEPEAGDKIFSGGTNPINFDYHDNWIWSVRPSNNTMEYRRVPNAYEFRFEFWFSDGDVRFIKDLIENHINPTFRLVSSRPDFYGERKFDDTVSAWIIQSLDPAYFDDIQRQQREKTWTGIRLLDPNP